MYIYLVIFDLKMYIKWLKWGPSPTAWASLRTTIELAYQGLQDEGPTGTTFFSYKGSEICRPKWFAIDKYIGNGDQG